MSQARPAKALSASARRAAASPSPAPPAPDEPLGRIVAAARDCFAREGISKTRMDHVAEAAEMTRQNLYRYVSGRGELVELAAVERSRELAQIILDETDPDSGDVEDALIAAIVTAVLIGRNDSEFNYLIEAIPRAERSVFVGSGQSPVHSFTRIALEPALRRAHEEGRLRTDISVDRMVEWLQGVLTLLNPRVDLDREALEDLLRDFTIPVLLGPSDLPRDPRRR